MPATISKVDTLIRKDLYFFVTSAEKPYQKVLKAFFVPLQPRPTADLDRAGDEVYAGVTAMVKQVVQLKNVITTLPSSEYPNTVKVGPAPLCSVVFKAVIYQILFPKCCVNNRGIRIFYN